MNGNDGVSPSQQLTSRLRWLLAMWCCFDFAGLFLEIRSGPVRKILMVTVRGKHSSVHSQAGNCRLVLGSGGALGSDRHARSEIITEAKLLLPPAAWTLTWQPPWPQDKGLHQSEPQSLTHSAAGWACFMLLSTLSWKATVVQRLIQEQIYPAR